MARWRCNGDDDGESKINPFRWFGLPTALKERQSRSLFEECKSYNFNTVRQAAELADAGEDLFYFRGLEITTRIHTAPRRVAGLIQTSCGTAAWRPNSKPDAITSRQPASWPIRC
jgi:hypothetical protein